MATETGPTENGGTYVAVFLDDDGNEVDKDKATRAQVNEFNKDGVWQMSSVEDLTTPEPAAP